VVARGNGSPSGGLTVDAEFVFDEQAEFFKGVVCPFAVALNHKNRIFGCGEHDQTHNAFAVYALAIARNKNVTALVFVGGLNKRRSGPQVHPGRVHHFHFAFGCVHASFVGTIKVGRNSVSGLAPTPPKKRNGRVETINPHTSQTRKGGQLFPVEAMEMATMKLKHGTGTAVFNQNNRLAGERFNRKSGSFRSLKLFCAQPHFQASGQRFCFDFSTRRTLRFNALQDAVILV
jgi:hypothetical protein